MSRLFKLLSGGLGLLILLILTTVLILNLRALNKKDETIITFQSPLSTATPLSPVTPQPSDTPAPSPTTMSTNTPVIVLEPNSPLPTPTPVYVQPPLCEFKAGSVAMEINATLLDEIVFSEPKVIFSREGAIEIVEWLPDNQQLLLHIRNQNKQSIEVLDTVTGKTQIYADNLENADQIHWLADEQAVVYVDRKTVQFSGIDQYGVWLSRGDPQQMELLMDDASLMQTAEAVASLSPEIAQALNIHQFSFDPEWWRYPKYPQDPDVLEAWADRHFRFAISPDDSKAIFYGLPWLYLVDLQSGEPCEIDLGKFVRAERVRWSPDSKWVAILTTRTEYPIELWPYSHLIVLNVETGEIYQPDINWGDSWDIAWLPNSQNLIVMGHLNGIEYPVQNQQIRVIDNLSKDFRLMLPDRFFGGGSQPDFQLGLSLDGHLLSVNCPALSDKSPLDMITNQICLITIDVHNQK